KGAAGDRPRVDGVHGPDHGRDRVHVEGLLRTLHREQLAETRVCVLMVDVLEAGRRLDVGHMQVGEMGEGDDGAPAFRRNAMIPDQVGAYDVRLARDLSQSDVGGGRTRSNSSSGSESQLVREGGAAGQASAGAAS